MATDIQTSFTNVAIVPPAIPRLEPGDQLTRDEFWRRYETTPDVKKAELIERVVYIAPPVSFLNHANLLSSVSWWLGTYGAHTLGVMGANNTTLQLDHDNVPQPDALMLIDPSLGGQSRIDDEGYLHGPPELIAEIASSSVSIDMHAKRHVYRRSGVCEYIVWRVFDRAIDWFVLRGSDYEPLSPDGEGVLRSEAFPGLWLHVPAMLDGRLDAVLAALERGLATPEHKTFVARLEQLAQQKKK